MNVDRDGAIAMLLPGGRVLIAGGVDNPPSELGQEPTASAEMYDPAAGRFTLTGSMKVARTGAVATLLQDGRVLVIGGNDGADIVASAEIYDPATGRFQLTGSMSERRGFGLTAVLLRDGRVLVIGGADNAPEMSSDPSTDTTAELYDPTSGRFELTGSMARARVFGFTATALRDGRVLIAGGTSVGGGEDCLAAAEIYDPASGTFAVTGSLTIGRDDASAARLADGRVLVAGGETVSNPGEFGSATPLDTAEIYDPATGAFEAAGIMTPAGVSMAADLKDGRILLLKHPTSDDSRTLYGVFDPVTETSSAMRSITFATWVDTVTVLKDGRVLLTGGSMSSNKIAALFTP